jgi:hypothetical protein
MRWAWLLLEGIAGTALVAALAGLFWSLLPGVPPIDQSLMVALGGVLVLVWPPVVLWLAGHRELTRGPYGAWGPAVRGLPRSARRIAIALFALLIIGWISTLPWIMKGNPEQQGADYVLNSHGLVMAVSRSDYQASMAAHDRFVAAILIGFYLGAYLTFRGRRFLALDQLHDPGLGSTLGSSNT